MHVIFSLDQHPPGNDVAEKQTKTTVELKAMVMLEIVRHPECRNIQDATIEPMPRRAPFLPNWRCSWVTESDLPADVAQADDLVRELQRQYDLS